MSRRRYVFCYYQSGPATEGDKAKFPGLSAVTIRYLKINHLRGFGNGYTINTYIDKYLPSSHTYNQNIDTRHLIWHELENKQDIILRSFSVGNRIAYYSRRLLTPQEKALSFIFKVAGPEETKEQIKVIHQDYKKRHKKILDSIAKISKAV